MKTRWFPLALGTALLASGCAPRTIYHWNGYDDRLYRHYKNPADRQTWVESLKTTILESENEGLKAPPGIYAEYGFALFEEGRGKDAVVYFKKERDQWPESRFLMEKMIRNAENRMSAPPGNPAVVPAAATKGPAGALEKAR